MFIEFELRQGKANVDGSRTIRAYISHNGKAYYTTKYAVKDNQFDCKRNKIKDIVPNSQLWNNELTRLKNEIEGLCLKHPNISATDIIKLIGKRGIDTFLSFFENFIKECEAGKHDRSIGTAKNYRKVLRSIEKFELRSDFDTINQKWYNEYIGQLRITGMNENSIGGNIKVVKMILRRAFDVGITTSSEFSKKYFKKTTQTTDSIYLSEDEMLLWENVDLKNYPHLQAEKDRFLLSYYFLLRFGDSLKVNRSNVFEQSGKRFIKLITEKTGAEIILPISTKALALLDKYDYQMPATTNQQANENLKTIGALALISTPVKLYGEVKAKCLFISSHTARRSAATNLYLQGLPLKELSHLLGHAKVQQTEQYIRISKIESAKKALDYAFFK